MLDGARFDGVERDACLIGIVLAIEVSDDPEEAGTDLVLHLLCGPEIPAILQGQDGCSAERQAHALPSPAAVVVQADLVLRYERRLDPNASAQHQIARVAVADPVALQPAGLVELLAEQDVDAIVLVEIEPVRLHHLDLERHQAVAVQQLRIHPLADQHGATHGGGPGTYGLVPIPVVHAIEVAQWRVTPALPQLVVSLGGAGGGTHHPITNPVVDDHPNRPAGIGIVVNQILMALDQPVPGLA